MERQILHVDVNNAFLSWTAIDMLENGYKEDIRNIISVIGGDETCRRGVVLAKSTLAKKYNILTGESIFMARKKCNKLQVFRGADKRYLEFSDNLYKMLLEYSDKVERYSIDECFLEMTGCLMGRTLNEIAIEIIKRVKEELKFTVNIGISNNKLLAKMASDFEKPDKIHTLFKEEIKDKFWTLPINELFMLGKKTTPKLLKMNIKTIGDLAKSNKNKIENIFGKHGKILWEYANGIDDSEVIYEQTLPKGIGHSITMSKDTSNIEELNKILLGLTEQVCYRLRKYNLKATIVNVQIRTKNFENYTRQKSLLRATTVTKEIYEQGKILLKELYAGRELRLIGIRVDGLVSTDQDVQISIFDEGKEGSQHKKYEKVDKVLDSIKDKHGDSLVMLGGRLK
ncbi:MAG: DNA polymerase IV [Clostridia bacterium]|nr:DNA polymerase IV [Clostridia bacterium]MDD4375365.1 DNA polymerase IV [Clostridia bacterium]